MIANPNRQISSGGIFGRVLGRIASWFRLEPTMYIELTIATLLFITNIVLTLTLPYYTEHKAYYESGPYIVLLVIAWVLYLVKLFSTKEKSASDIAVILFAFLILWEVAYKVGWIQNDLLIPSPEGLFHVFVEKPTEIINDVIGSVELLFFGVLFAILLGTGLGLLAGWVSRVRAVLLPISNVITLIPPLMFSAYLIIILPTFRMAAIAVIFFAVFWPTFQGTVSRVGQIDPKVIEAAKTMGVGTAGMLVKVIFPYCLPGIISSVSKSLRGAFMCLSGAEMLGINLGIGFFIEKYKSFADYRCVLAGIFTVGVITTLIDIAINKIEKAVIKWKY